MSAKRLVGLTLSALGLLAILVGSVVAGAASPDAAPAGGATSFAAATGAIGLGWALAALGVALSFAGIVLTANARGAFF